MLLDRLILIVLAEILLLPILGSLLYWLLSRQADDSQNHPPLYNDASYSKSTPEERDDHQPTDEPEEPTSNESSTSLFSAPESDGDCERRLRLVRASCFLRGRLEEQNRELLLFERQVIDEATRLLSGGDCVNDALLFTCHERYIVPPSLDKTYEAECTRIYGLSPLYILAYSTNKHLVTITNHLGDLTRDSRLTESDIAGLKWDVVKAQSILINCERAISGRPDPKRLVDLSTLYFGIHATYRYLRSVADWRQQHFEVLSFWRPRQGPGWELPNPHFLDPDGWWAESRESHGVVRDADTRPCHLVEQTQGAQLHRREQYPVQPVPSPPPHVAHSQYQRPAAMDDVNCISPQDANPPPSLPSQPPPRRPSRAPSQIPTITSQRQPHNPTESRRRPSTIPHEQSPNTSAAPQPISPTRDPTPPLMEGPNRTGRIFRFEDLLGGGRGGKLKKKKGKGRKQD